ncbi:MFS transporter [Adlercreutzia sp. ZJ304]|uniref:MFS transporter n=1 Tax=Adlercreutzia sp. ZJ304 TaxID=2709791 RepID=UPI0013EB8938|nr:MFS transporter [Adlercreutzia sp. ZJ304]
MFQSTKQTAQTANLTAGGHALPADWLGRIVLIWSGYAVSMFAGNAASYAGIWYATETTGSPLSLAFLYVLAFLPMGLLSPFGGVVADKLNRKVIIVVCDALMALTSLALAAWTFIAGPSFAAVALYCAAFGFVSGFRTPAYNATMPLLVPERHLVRINSIDTLLGSISMIAGPALGILLYTSFGLQYVLILGGFGAAAADVTMLLAVIPRDHGAHEQAGAWASLKEGASTLASQRGLLVLTIGVSLGMLAYGPIDSLMPLMVYDHFGGDGFAASLVAAVMGAGLLVGSVILMAVNPRRKLARIIVVSAFVVGTGALIAGLVPKGGYWAFVVCIGVLAIACAWFNAPLMTLLQKNIPDEKLGRVMGLFTAMNGLAIPAGTALGGLIAEVTGTPLFFQIDGVFILLLAVSIAISKSVRKLDAASSDHPTVEQTL